MAQWQRNLGAVCVLVVLAGALRAQTPDAAQARLTEGAKYEANKQFPAAADSYRAALKAGGSGCVACLEALARVQLKMDDYKGSAATSAQLAAHAPDAKAKAQAEMREGLALYRLYFAQTVGIGDIPKDEKRALATLKQTEPILKQAETDDPANEELQMLHARVLAALKQDESASLEFAACAAAPGASKEECVRALHFSKDVSLARGEPAPAFELKTIDGKKVSLDSLAGKIVLVDFWATWCTFCERDSDYVQSMLDSFDDGRFVLLEVSVDENESQWRDYVDHHRLHGLQTLDSEKAVGDLFQVKGYPTYVVLDGDGIVRLRAVGIEGDLKGTVKRLLAAGSDQAPSDRKLLPKAGAE
jgi:peroxiredoxin